MTLNHFMIKAKCVLLTDINYRTLKEPRKIKRFEDPYASHQGLKVSCNPKISQN